ncbi:glycosyl transferase family 2 [Cuneatibacter caecimuris]|uniref:Glycosyl transferase family 2 n=1 Tax=Cuneatibacter caecimuris TaxID=1796618 RepID=A0A4Q7PME9_9FIRM|nr:glycosyl transferase family 2 [Cuneatibacter caecimuris]
MKIEHLISTMHQADAAFLQEIKCVEDVLVVNQTNIERTDEQVTSDGKRLRMISTEERGLSNSRNMLLKNAAGDIAILGDDDLIYLDGYLDKIQKAYQEHPDADIIAFSFTESLTQNTRRQFKTARKLNIFTISKVASVELTFRTKPISDADIFFCPLLGLGAKYGACEENAFLADALRAGLTIWYVPETICYLRPDPPGRMKWQQGFNEDYFVKRGACFYRIYRKAFALFSIAFILLKKRSIFRDVPIVSAWKWMCEGRKLYQKDEEEQECS